MTRVTLIVTALACLTGGAAAGYLFAHRGARGIEESPARPPDAASQQAAGEREVLYWHDPMVPGAKFDKPGKSPFMDMDLVPVYADAIGTGPAVRVPSNVSQSLGIRIGTVERSRVQPRFRAVGSVAFDENRLQVVQARVEGYVARLHVRAPLERVRRGQALADIVAPQWLAAEEEYLALLDAESERGRSIRAAARRRLLVLGVPETVIRGIETNRTTADTTRLVAPIDGVVTDLAVREGATFMPGGALFRINGLDTVWVNAQVPEAQVSMIPTGASVTARATAWPDSTFTGRVTALLPEIDPRTRTMSVRVAIDNPELRLAPGMFVSLDFAGEAGAPQLVVPSEAVIMTGERSVVIVARDEGGFDVSEVTVGAEADGRTAILEGLEEGQKIVLSGQFLIDSEASLKSAVTRLTTGAAPGTPTEPAP
jgi:membrane fusion protein, copper/silver efflux system